MKVSALAAKAVEDPRRLLNIPGHLWTRARIAHLEALNRRSSAPVTSPFGPVVNVTSYGDRLSTVHLALESIADGTLKPGRLILWADDQSWMAHRPASIRRLEARGLEVLPCEDLKPHKKYWPYVSSDDAEGGRGFAVADDDLLYPRAWLARLADAARRTPGVVVAHRAREVRFTGRGEIAPYATWPDASSDAPSFRTFSIGIGGVLYPPEMIRALRASGERFRECAPTADDVWLHSVAVSAGIRSRQVAQRPMPVEFRSLPNTQKNALMHVNVTGGNDVQIAQTYTPEALERMFHVSGAQ